MNSASSLETIFFECLRKDTPEERDAYLAQACAGDPVLLSRLRKMLEAEDTNFLEQAAHVPDQIALSPATFHGSGQRIGAYRLVEQIGEGGMGTVFRAEQIEPVQRQVALKLIKAGMDSQQVIARFETERQALALMDHPNIARVLDGGTDGAGRPYFVMDLFAGLPITKYCDERRLALRQRLELFVQVCNAIQHAHQKGVIHRDIKPSNVLVALQDGRASAKVIDFGIAKAIEQKLSDRTALTQQRTAFTQLGGFVGTLEYMSPEQAARSSGGVDTRSDIYSLGALLYELLTGTTPLLRQRLEQASFGDILRVITDGETPKPSTRLRETGEEIAAISAQRRVEPARLASLVRGELDWIVMKALEKDRERRYATAADFAQDVQRYLADEPVLACPPSAAYRLRKFARRNRGALAAATVLIAALLVTLVSIGWAVRDRAAQEAEVARAKTDRQARVSAAVHELLAEADRQLSAQAWPEALATVRRADVAATSGEADTETAHKVDVLLRDLELVARLERVRSRQATQFGAGFDSAAAAREYARAFRDHDIDIAGSTVETIVDRLRTNAALAIPLAAGLDDWARRDLEATRQLAGWQRITAVASALDPERMRNLIRAYWGRPAAAAAEEMRRLSDSLDLRAQHPVTLVNLARCLQRADLSAVALRLLRDAQRMHPDDFWLNFELGVALHKERNIEGAVRYATAAVAIRPDSAAAYSNLGHYLQGLRDVDAALACFRRAIELDPNLVMPRVNLGSALLEQKKPDEALASMREAAELDPQSAHAWVGLGAVLLELKQPDAGAEALRRAIELDPENAQAHAKRSDVLRGQGKVQEALVAARRAVASDANEAGCQISLGNALAMLGNTAESIVAFQKAIELEPHSAVAHANLGTALQSLEDPSKLDDAIAACRKAIELDPDYAPGHLGLGSAMLTQRQWEAAIAAYRRAIELDASLDSAHFNLGLVLSQQKRTDEALASYKNAILVRPNRTDAYRAIALLHRERNELSEAAEALQTLVDLAPDAHVYHLLAVVLTDLRRSDEALAAYRRAAEIEPQNAIRPWALGVCLQRLGRLDEAVAAYEKAIELDPQFALAYGVLGDTLHFMNKDLEAILAYRSAIELDPKFVGAYHGLGQALQTRGQFAEAIEAIEQAIRLDPTNADAAGDLALLLATCPDSKFRDGARAVELARKAVDLEPTNGGHFSALGAAHYRAGNWQDALDATQVAIDLRQSNRGFDWFFMAMEFWQLGDPEAARSSFTRASDWMAKHRPDDAEFRRLREEAARLLGVEIRQR